MDNNAVGQKASKRLEQASINLTLEEPFFGVLTLMFLSNRVEKSDIPAMATDGETLYYNPEWVNSLSMAELQGVICHEDWHVALLDPWREQFLPLPALPTNIPPNVDTDGLLKKMRHVKANHAMDYRINAMIQESGGKLPSGALIDPKYTGMAMEQIYRLLPDPPVTFLSGIAQCGDCGMGEVMPAPGDKAEQRQSESNASIAVRQAMNAAKMQGRLPAGIERAVNKLLRPRNDPKAILLRFMQDRCRNDYTWRRPSPRYLSAGLYIPSLYSEELGEIAFGIDTSGSIDDEALNEAGSIVNVVLSEMRPSRAHVVYCDAAASADTFERGEGLVFRPVGGGGTDFRPVFEYVEKKEIAPVCLIYITDLHGTFPTEPPNYPVLWLTTTDQIAPWGETVRLEWSTSMKC